MLIRVVVVLALFAACSKERQAAPAPAPVAVRDASVASDPAVAVRPAPPDAQVAAVDAMPPPPADAGPADYSQLVTAEWPSVVEIIEHEAYYRFRSRPPELAKLMNKWMEPFIAASKSSDYDVVRCAISTSSRIAVVGQCKTMRTTPPEGHGGAPAGEDPTFFAWWMQPGLPEITIDELAPDVDVKQLFARTYAAAPADCPLDQCRFEPYAFLLDAEGVTFEPAEYCSPTCLRPKIALEDLHPKHPWGKKLVAWMRQRVEAYESVVKYVVKP